MIRRVGEVLRFETHPAAGLISFSVSAKDRAVEVIARIELHAWLRGKHFQHAARCGIPGASR